MCGTARAGQDYPAPAGSIIVASGLNSAVLTLIPFDDDFPEDGPAETIQLDLAPGPYAIHVSSNSATATIQDNEAPVGSLAGLQLWLKADTGVESSPGVPAVDGANVDLWLDQAGTPNNAQQIGNPPRFSHHPDGYPLVSFTPGNNLFVPHAAELNAGAAQTVFLSLIHTCGDVLVQKDNSPAGWAFSEAAYSVGNAQPGPLAPPKAHALRLLTGRYDGTRLEIYHNGRLQETLPFTDVINNTAPITIGEADAEFHVAEMMVFNRALNESEREQVETYFFSKYPMNDQPGLVISEIMYHPAFSGGVEFVEVLNQSPLPLDLTNHRFDNGIEFSFGPGWTIQPGEYLVAAADTNQFLALYPNNTQLAGTFFGQLNNGGERLTLSRRLKGTWTEVDSLEYVDAGTSDGDGSSLELIHPGFDNAFPETWRDSSIPGGTPGAANSGFEPVPSPIAVGVTQAPHLPAPYA
ncbi:MAG: lamin tail domain-containing protein, partial [Verrucomicrobiota bacterium]